MVGMPEARIIYSQAVIAVATSPKSNRAYLAIDKALADLEQRDTGAVPFHIRNAPADGMKDLGYGEGYKYDHDFPSGISGQTFLPDEILGTIYYEPSESGYEKKIADWMRQVDDLRQQLHSNAD